MLVAGWVDGFRITAEAFGWTQTIVFMLLVGIVFFGIMLNTLIKRRNRDSVFGHRVYLDE